MKRIALSIIASSLLAGMSLHAMNEKEKQDLAKSRRHLHKLCTKASDRGPYQVALECWHCKMLIHYLAGKDGTPHDSYPLICTSAPGAKTDIPILEKKNWRINWEEEVVNLGKTLDRNPDKIARDVTKIRKLVKASRVGTFKMNPRDPWEGAFLEEEWVRCSESDVL